MKKLLLLLIVLTSCEIIINQPVNEADTTSVTFPSPAVDSSDVQPQVQ